MRQHTGRFSLALSIAFVSASLASAQSGGQQSGSSTGGGAARTTHPIAVPTATAVSKSGPIVLDGKLDDAAWQTAQPITDFKQFDPDHGEPATERIDVRFLYDDGGLYVGARLYDKLGAQGVTSTVVRRDAFFNSDYFEVVIDGFHDHLGRAFFQVNPSGSKTD